MAQPSPSDPRYQLESQIRECFGRCAYSHKTHEKMAEQLAGKQNRVKWYNIVISALVTGGAVGALFPTETRLFAYTTAALAVFSLVVNAYMKDIDPGALAQRHREAASDLWNVRENYLSLLTDIGDEVFTIENLRERRDGLQLELHQIYKGTPQTNGHAYGEAQDALKNKEDLTFSEKEIDVMLPVSLRRDGRT